MDSAHTEGAETGYLGPRRGMRCVSPVGMRSSPLRGAGTAVRGADRGMAHRYSFSCFLSSGSRASCDPESSPGDSSKLLQYNVEIFRVQLLVALHGIQKRRVGDDFGADVADAK